MYLRRSVVDLILTNDVYFLGARDISKGMYQSKMFFVEIRIMLKYIFQKDY